MVNARTAHEADIPAMADLMFANCAADDATNV
jgi:hypothetical protein